LPEAHALMSLAARQSLPGALGEELERLAGQMSPGQVERARARAEELRQGWKNGRPWPDNATEDAFFLRL